MQKENEAIPINWEQDFMYWRGIMSTTPNERFDDTRDLIARLIQQRDEYASVYKAALLRNEALTKTLDTIHTHCVAGSADPRPGVARSSIIRIGEICEERFVMYRKFRDEMAE